jgi:[ribosomal protein S5]-alanine N-acetyltransferase
MEPSPLGLPLQTSRVVVRSLRPSDLPQFCCYRADPVLAKYQDWSPMSENQSLHFLRKMQTAKALVAGDWIQLAFTLARQYQGLGLATEAVALVVDSVFISSVATKVRGITDARNVASIDLLGRVGFCKVSEHQTTFKGEACIEYIFERTRTAEICDAS